MPNTVNLDSIDEISRAFMPPEHAPGGDDPYPCMTPFLKPGLYRALHADEIATLVKNNNNAESWAEILVTGAFNPNLINNCEFYGRVLIGDLTPRFIEHHDLRLPWASATPRSSRAASGTTWPSATCTTSPTT